MALIQCKKCDRMISSLAKHCPHCKTPLLEFKGINISYNKKSSSNFYKNLILLLIGLSVLTLLLYYNYTTIFKKNVNSNEIIINGTKLKTVSQKALSFGDENEETKHKNKNECKLIMQKIVDALELYQMENGTQPHLSPELLLKNGYMRSLPVCPSAYGEKFFNYSIYIGNKEVQVKCKIHGTLNFYDR